MNNNENYFKDNFTKEGEKVNLEINKLTAECITSKNNKFSLDDEGNLSVNSITTNGSNNQSGVTVDMIYPVGSIYMSVNGANPSELFGGTWEQIQDKFLLACGNTYPVGSMGGEESHILTIGEMPSHYHSRIELAGLPLTAWNPDAGQKGYKIDSMYLGITSGVNEFITGYAGGNQSHNNMPPYLAVYIWKRVA